MHKTPDPTAVPEDSGSTANTLLDTAEHLFATQGIETVSMRRIALECGHGNRSGALYHFGSREALIRKLLERRMQVVDALRHARLDQIIADGNGDDLAQVIGCGINVLADVVRAYPWGADYVLVMAQALLSPRVQLSATIDAHAITGNKRLAAMVRSLLPDLPAEQVNARLRIFFYDTTYVFARWLQEHGALTSANENSFQAMVTTVSEFMLGGLAAPSAQGRVEPVVQLVNTPRPARRRAATISV